jgi:hypothetical protein
MAIARCRRSAGPAVLLVLALLLAAPAPGRAQVKAQPAPQATPTWGKGILPIDAESYWNAVACGKQGGENPPCVFWDTGICRNDDFTLAMYTPYKMVAYEVWQAVRQGKEAPTPNYQQAQQTRVTIGITPVRGSKNTIKNVVVTRGGKKIEPIARSVTPQDARFTFDTGAFAPTASITIDLVGEARTLSCTLSRAALASYR